ncbi:ISAs1 family transposase [Rhodococcus sp. USK10]|uniref:ISAs1 family transposase n=1 Tax=Rhodococcus sp. USK10 TaxID=2789739 RepID=UPI0027E48714|nr:ISAs1 family transposase [Rhodococcus sp. USK10]
MWMWTRTYIAGQRRVIALDGKTVRGARDRTDDAPAPHLVAVFDHNAGAVLGQLCVDAKSNEIPAARTLLNQFDLDGVVVTMDALHTQTDTATLITEAGGDYVFTVKANMPTLHRNHKALPWKDIPAARHTTTARVGVSPAPSRSLPCPTGSTFPAPCRSHSCGAPSPGEARRPSRWST